jgi:tetratricopeptide (TPR) repeat protein
MSGLMAAKPYYTSVRVKFYWSIADFTKGIAIDPQNDSLFYNRGLAFSSRCNLTDEDFKDCNFAVTDFSQAIPLSSKPRQIYMERASAYRKLGMTDRAIADEKKAFELGSN